MFPAFVSFAESLRRETENWVTELNERSRGREKGGKERRFVFPLLAPTSAQYGTMCPDLRFSPWRASAAMTDAYMLFQTALYMYGDDMGKLVKRTVEITTKNSHLYAGTPFATDFSSLSSMMEMNSLFIEMVLGASKESIAYWSDKTAELIPAITSRDHEAIARFWEHQVEILDTIVNKNPAALEAIRKEMGFQFGERDRFEQIAETERAILYQVFPLKEGVRVRIEDGKPNMHLSPFILPENILDLLARQGVSLVGAFANSGTPTYFVHIKNILETPAVQIMSEEDLLRDVKYFSRVLHVRHGMKVTLFGTCQGALPMFHAVCSPGLAVEEHVDALGGIVPAYALASSPRVRKQMDKIPPSKRNLLAITERLPNGNVVVVGEPSALSSRLGNPAQENPVSRLVADMRSAEKGTLSPMALAMRAYLGNIRPMPFHITAMSQLSATVPITKDGVFPTSLFGKPVTFKHAIKKGIRMHVVAGGKDTVVDPDAALAMFKLDCIKKYSGATHHLIDGAGHVAVMTTCTRDEAKNFIGNAGGPLWFHLKLEAELMQTNVKE